MFHNKLGKDNRRHGHFGEKSHPRTVRGALRWCGIHTFKNPSLSARSLRRGGWGRGREFFRQRRVDGGRRGWDAKVLGHLVRTWRHVHRGRGRRVAIRWLKVQRRVMRRRRCRKLWRRNVALVKLRRHVIGTSTGRWHGRCRVARSWWRWRGWRHRHGHFPRLGRAGTVLPVVRPPVPFSAAVQPLLADLELETRARRWRRRSVRSLARLWHVGWRRRGRRWRGRNNLELGNLDLQSFPRRASGQPAAGLLELLLADGYLQAAASTRL